MTFILPVSAGLMGYAAGGPWGAAGGFVVGWFGRYSGNGVLLNRKTMAEVEVAMHRAIAANWGIRPLALMFTEAEQQKLLGSMFDAVAGPAIQMRVEQWPIIWAHVQRVHFSAIPPLASLKRMNRAYRPTLFRKDKTKGREIALPVVEAYATLHPNPDSAFDWYMRWAQSIGLPEEIAHQTWSETIAAGVRRPEDVVQPDYEDVAEIVTARQTEISRRAPRSATRDLSDDEIARRMAATRG